MTVTAASAGRTGTDNGHQVVMAWQAGGMGHFPAALVTGCTVATDRKGLAGGTADPGAVDIVTAIAGVVNLRISSVDQRRWIQVTQSTGRTCYRHQRTVVGIGRGMQSIPGRRVTSHTVATVSRNTRLQGWGCGVTQRTVIQVSGHDRAVDRNTGIVTVQTDGRATGDVTERHVINTAVNGQALVAVTGQTVGRVACGDRSDDVYSRAVVTGRARTGAVSRNIVFSALDLGPVGDDVTAAAQLTRGVVRQVPCSF